MVVIDCAPALSIEEDAKRILGHGVNVSFFVANDFNDLALLQVLVSLGDIFRNRHYPAAIGAAFLTFPSFVIFQVYYFPQYS